MKKWFDVRFFKERFLSLKATGIIIGIILMLQAVLVPLMILLDGDFGVGADGAYFELVHPLSMAPLLTLVPFVAITMSFFILRDFDTRNGSDFYHALPITRNCFYMTSFAAVMSWAVLLFFVPLITENLLLNLQRYACDLSELGKTIVIIFVLTFYIVSAIFCGRGFTGTKFSHVTLTLMILVFPRLFISVITAIIEGNAPYLILGRSKNIIFDNTYNLLIYMMENDGEISLASTLYTLGLSLVYFLGGLWLFRKRPSETAVSPASSYKVQTVVRNLLALAVSLGAIALMVYTVLNTEISGDEIVLNYFGVFVLYIVAVLTYFIYEIMSTKKLSNVKRVLKGLGGVFIGNVVIYVFIAIVLIAVHRVPDAEDMKQVQMIDVGNDYWYARKTQSLQLLEDYAITESEFLQEVSKELEDAVDAGNSWRAYYEWDNYYDVALTDRFFEERTEVDFAIQTKTGTMYRTILLSRRAMSLLKENKEICQLFYDSYLPKKAFGTGEDKWEDIYLRSQLEYVDTSLNSEQLQKLYAALKQDHDNLTPEQWADVVLPDESLKNRKDVCLLSTRYYEYRVSQFYYEFALIPEYMPLTIIYLKSLGVYDTVFGTEEIETLPTEKYFLYNEYGKLYFVNDNEDLWYEVFFDEYGSLFILDEGRAIYLEADDYLWYQSWENGDWEQIEPQYFWEEKEPETLY